MSTTAAAPLLHTPFHSFHLQHGGKMVDFAGWDMPLHYGSILDEHHQVRTSGGLFDVSHMGRFRFSGRDARKFLDHVCTRQIVDMPANSARYSLVCNEEGGCRDDVLVYRIDDTEFVMVCNASNRLKLIEHFEQVKSAKAMVFKFIDETLSTGMVALQGPKVIEMIANFSRGADIEAIPLHGEELDFRQGDDFRTGYTGEDGVEVILPAKFAGQAVSMLASNVGDEKAAIKPAGLGARDSLRLEAGMALYGHEITEQLDPLSAGLSFAMKLEKGDDNPEAGRFIGQDALQKLAREGLKRKLVGLKLEGKRSARQHMKVMQTGKVVGEVTSGCLSPTLCYPIAMAYLNMDQTPDGTAVQIDLGKAMVEAQVVPLPFYKSK